ncbi:MAG: hypothetical protein WC517_04375 [Patescibacteria group bacterium]
MNDLFAKQDIKEQEDKATRSEKAKELLQILLPLSLAAGGAYTTYKMFPKLVNYIAPKKPSYITGGEIQATLEAANRDILYSASKFFKEQGIKLEGMI